LTQVSALQTDCDNYETEIQTLFREIKEKNLDMNVLTEAFEKRGSPPSLPLPSLVLSSLLAVGISSGELINELEATNLRLNSHLAKQVAMLQRQEEMILNLQTMEDKNKRDVCHPLPPLPLLISFSSLFSWRTIVSSILSSCLSQRLCRSYLLLFFLCFSNSPFLLGLLISLQPTAPPKRLREGKVCK
jgi:hypothetical protein